MSQIITSSNVSFICHVNNTNLINRFSLAMSSISIFRCHINDINLQMDGMKLSPTLRGNTY